MMMSSQGPANLCLVYKENPGFVGTKAQDEASVILPDKQTKYKRTNAVR